MAQGASEVWYNIRTSISERHDNDCKSIMLQLSTVRRASDSDPLQPASNRHRRRAAALIVSCAFVTLTVATSRSADADASDRIDRIVRDTRWLADSATRVVGSTGHDQAVARLLGHVEEIPGASVWTHRFPVMVPRVERARIVIDGGALAGRHRIYPLWPASVRLNTTPDEGIQGRLIYVGEASVEAVGRLPAGSLRGQIAVMEAAGGNRWRDVARAGAAAILLLDGAADGAEFTQRHAATHLLPLPIHVPRFFVPDGNLSTALRGGTISTGRVISHCKWVRAEATNIYALVTPAEGQAELRGARRAALAIAAPIDSGGLVPELAAGADAAVDAAVLLDALRHFAVHRPARPLLFAFLDAQAINQLGVRQMLGTLALSPDNRARSVTDDRKLAREYRQAEELAAAVDASDDVLATLSQRHYSGLSKTIRDEVDREVIAVDAALEPLRLRLTKAEGDEQRQIAAKVGQLTARRTAFRSAHALMTRADASDSRDADLARLAGELWKRARRRIRLQLQQVEDIFEIEQQRDRWHARLLQELNLSGSDDPPRPIDFLLGLDLSDAGFAAGPSRFCFFNYTDETANSKIFRAWLQENVQRRVIWTDEHRTAVNLEPFEGWASADSFVLGDVATLTSPAVSFSTPAVTWSTLNAPRRKVDTPRDHPDRLDWSRLRPQIEATLALLEALAADPSFAAHGDALVPQWSRVSGKIVDVSPGAPVPRLPMEGYLTTLVIGRVGENQVTPTGPLIAAGVRRQQFVRTGADGRFLFELMPSRVGDGRFGEFYLQSYRLADDGRIVRAIDYRRSGAGVVLGAPVSCRFKSNLRAVVFDCRELSLLGLFDARFLEPLTSASFLNARTLSDPKRSNVTVYDGLLSAQLEPDLPWQLILGAGITRNRMALLNTIPQYSGATTRQLVKGFSELAVDATYIGARDWFRLDRHRLANFHKAGISSVEIDELQRRTERLLAEAEQAESSVDFERASGAALATEMRVYQAVLGTASDVVRGAVFLLMLLVPFSYAMERLLVASTSVYRQIIAMMAIFTAMSALLWSFHPAFRISSQPLTVIMAFGVIFMSGLVIVMVYRKFESELEKFRSGRAEASGARTSRLGVLSTAIRLGIANMRRRRLRTALTGFAVVLITFVLLCFVSTRRYANDRQYPLAGEPQYTGVLIRQAGGRPLPEQIDAALRSIVRQPSPAGTALRYWWLRSDPDWRLPVSNPGNGKRVGFKSALGLSADEVNLSAVGRVCPNWGNFAERGGCYMASQRADALGIKPGDRVFVAGQSLELIGVLDPGQFDHLVVDLDGRSMLPTDFSALTDEQRRALAPTDQPMSHGETETGADIRMEADLPALSSREVLILPASVLRGVRDCQLKSIALAARDGHEAERIAEQVAQRLAYSVIFGAPERGLRVVASTPLFPTAPWSLFIPLLIGGLIIFNTMLSSIAERQREIYVYTSLGLAPVHVGFLFLAEALTYGLMGSIFGYVVGQAVGTCVSRLGGLGGLTLNYSGSQAVMIMVLVLVIVTVASLLPAWLAGRLAAPSHKRSWQVPPPVGDQIRDSLPFTVTGVTRTGMVAFLYQYLDAHREASSGHFSTDHLRTFQDSTVIGIEGTVWLTPYDLGVRQEIRLSIHPTEIRNIFAIDIELHRASGSVPAWHKLNKLFLRQLRRQLLGWRKLSRERRQQYLSEGREMLTVVCAHA